MNVEQPLPWVQLNDPEIVDLLANPIRRRMFEVFIGQTITLKKAAELLGAKSNSLLYQVGKMLELGILIQVGVQRSKTRTSVLYTAFAQEIYVPFATTRAATLEEFMVNIEGKWDDLFIQLLSKTLTEFPTHFKGIVYRREGNKVVRHFSSDGHRLNIFLEPEAPAVSMTTQMLELNPEDAKALQQDLQELWQKYAANHGSHRYLMRLGLTPWNT